MKLKVLYSITALLILTLSFVVYASLNTTSAKTDSCCAMADCCKDGKCKMNHDCCKDKDSCPMKSKEKASGEMKDCPMHNKDNKEMSAMHNHEGKCCDKDDCCKDGKCSMSADGKCACEGCKDGKCKMHNSNSNESCCKGKDSCPMKKKEGENKPKDN